jgi:phosphoglycolate phosphatase
MKAVIFDFDGTLADTVTMMYELNDVVTKKVGLDPLTKSELEDMRKMTYLEMLKYLKMPVRMLPKIVRVVTKGIKGRINFLKPNPGMKAVVNRLSKTDGLEIGLLSSNSRSNVYKFLEKHKMKDKFNFVESGVSLFAKQIRLRQVLKKHRLKAEDCIYVGDEVRDIEAVKKIPMRIIAVPWGFNHPSVLKQNKPNWLIKDPKEIIEIALAQLD